MRCRHDPLFEARRYRGGEIVLPARLFADMLAQDARDDVNPVHREST